ncbi:MAG: Integration host factor subunit alpha [Ignavibacteria bacterium]|nr:Integration host factor subunit alpha [Ignavibacteria bacterium]
MSNKKNENRVKTFTRKDIEEILVEKLLGKRLTQKLIVDSFIDSLRELIMRADPLIRIELRDFGVFEVKKTKPKPKARNLQTGEFVFVPGRRKMHFKPGKILKEFLKSEILKTEN